VLDQWTRELAQALGIELDLDHDLVLDLAGDAARSVVRPAAPLTTFLVGYAAALRGGGDEAVRAAAATASGLAADWARRADSADSSDGAAPS
jgi:hypothetical protein